MQVEGQRVDGHGGDGRGGVQPDAGPHLDAGARPLGDAGSPPLACVADFEVARAPRTEIVLRWIPGYPEDSQAHLELSVRWALSLLGARLHPEHDAQVFEWLGPRHVRVALWRAGFDQQALAALGQICAHLRASEAFAKTGGVDAGRFLLLTIGTSAHYYAITAMPKTLDAFLGALPPLHHEVQVLQSTVAHHHRRLLGVDARCADQIAWIAEEGQGELTDGSFSAVERETLDVMPNGQPRFAVYDSAGELAPWGRPDLGGAGKPGRCMFCHEGGVEPLWTAGATGVGGMTREAFNTLRASQMTLLRTWRVDHPSQAPLDVLDAHVLMEIRMAAFLEPTAARLAAEWQLPRATVLRRVQGLPTHEEVHYRAWTAPSYQRDDVARLLPWGVVRAPSSPYDPGGYEPNLLDP